MNSATRSVVLIQRARDGDRRALQRLLTEVESRLLARVRRRMPAALLAKLEPEDILQQAYVEAVAHVATFEYRGPRSFFRWLIRIVDHKLASALRSFRAAARDVARERRAGPHGSYAGLAHALRDQATSPSGAACRRELVGAMLAALAGLPEDYRRVLQLRYLEGRPVAEVAGALGRSAGAVHMLCARALRALRAAMDEISSLALE